MVGQLNSKVTLENQLKVVHVNKLKKEEGWTDYFINTSVLANPFFAQSKEELQKVNKAYRWWLWKNIEYHKLNLGADNVLLVDWINRGLTVSEKFSNPTVNMVTKELIELTMKINRGEKIRFMCRCSDGYPSDGEALIKCLLWIMG